MTEFFKVETTEQHVVILTLDRPDKEVNVLSEPVVRELAERLTSVAQDDKVTGLVLTSGKKDFLLGADIEDITRFKTPEETQQGASDLQKVFSLISSLKVPTVAAISGQCLGGGLEMALSCTWRIATDDPQTKLGLPEIQLGLIPGAGGTQRLPRLIGIQAALDLILTGKTVPSRKAKKLGLVDRVVPKHLLKEVAIQLVGTKRSSERKASKPLAKALAEDLPRWATEHNALGRRLIARKAREMVDKNTKGHYPAPYKALDAVFDGFDLRLDKGLELEAKLFGQLAHTRESNALVHLFHAITHSKKNPYRDAGRERFGDQGINAVGVIGAGFMGAGIATVVADKGIKAYLSDPSKESIGRALSSARSYFDKKVRKKRLKPFEAGAKFSRIFPGLSPTGFSHCDIVVEAVYEDLQLKRKILADIEKSASENQVFASNTSALPIAQIAENAAHPERVLGMHFFSPVEKMPLLEIIVTPKTAAWATARAVELGKAMGKQIIVVKDSPGFYTTRALAFFLAEAALLLSEGHRIEVIDRALNEFGFPVGPITLIDEVGIDVGAHVLETIGLAFPDRLKIPDALSEVKASGRLGRKNAKGFYRYENGKKAGPDSSIYELVKAPAIDSAIPVQEIVDRCVLLFVNESIRCLEEGIIASPYDGDVGAVFGLGFPPFWGGPFKYADMLGAKAVVDQLLPLADKYGARFAPAAILTSHAVKGTKFFPNER